MAIQKVKLQVLGNLTLALQREIADHIEIVAHDEGLRTDGVLVDGQSGSKIDVAALQQALEGGKLLAVIRPGTALQKLLGVLTGQAPVLKPALVIYKKAADAPGYHCTLIPEGTAAYARIDETGSSAITPARPIYPAIGEAITRAAFESPVTAPIREGFVPPRGALAGYASFSTPLHWAAGCPGRTGDQAIRNQALTEFYVYWVNGGDSPYYTVILRQTGTMGIDAAKTAAYKPGGWFQTYFQIMPNTVEDCSEIPMTRGVARIAHTPESSAGCVSTSLQVPMALRVKAGSSWKTVPFEAKSQGTLNYPGWVVADRTGSCSTAWESYQIQGWNPLQDPPVSFRQWGAKTYDDSEGKQMADISFESLPYEAMTVWQFEPPLFAPSASEQGAPPSLPVHFSGGWAQDVYRIHDGNGPESDKSRYLCGMGAEWPWRWGIDLGTIAALQNL